MSILDPIRSAVAAASSVVASAIALLNGLKDQLDAAIADDDMEAVEEIASQIAAQTESLAAAVAENTAAADEQEDQRDPPIFDGTTGQTPAPDDGA